MMGKMSRFGWYTVRTLSDADPKVKGALAHSKRKSRSNVAISLAPVRGLDATKEDQPADKKAKERR
jgi:hypothetical protein